MCWKRTFGLFSRGRKTEGFIMYWPEALVRENAFILQEMWRRSLL